MTSFNVNATVPGPMEQISYLTPRFIVNHGILTTVGTVVTVLVTFFFHIKRRREAVMKRSGSLKKLKYWNKWFGTIPSMVDIYNESPPKAHPQVHGTLLYRKHDLDGVFFLDAWPAMSEPQIVICDPDVAAQVTQAQNPTKHKYLRYFIGHAVGRLSMLLTEGALWKKTRSMFNPGFAPTHLMTLVPSIVDDALIFYKNIEKASKSEDIFFLEELAALFAFDVMGHIVLDHDLNSQLSPNELVDSFRNVVKWTPEATNVNPFAAFNPLRKFAYIYYGRKMDKYIGRILDARFSHRSHVDQDTLRRKRKPGIDLALDEYIKLQKDEGKTVMQGLDPHFKALAVDSMRTFLFAGSDSTSTAITYVFHSLSKHPEALHKVITELNDILGKDLARASDTLKEDSSLVNKLVYLGAVVKETLRLYPPASAVRNGHSSVNFTYKGISYPTDGAMIWINNHTIHRRADLFPSPDSFIPERFLPAEDPNRYQEVPKDAWRPFEKGPRNCIGQELAQLEIKIVVALTIREFDIRNAYKEYDEKLGRPNPGEIEGGRRGMFGDRAWQILESSSKPVDGYPAFVSRRNAATHA